MGLMKPMPPIMEFIMEFIIRSMRLMDREKRIMSRRSDAQTACEPHPYMSSISPYPVSDMIP